MSNSQLDFEPLRRHFKGELVSAKDGERYDKLRAVFNAMFDRRPGVIARPTDAADVAAAIAFARERDLPLAVRGGGHSVAGYSTCDAGVVIDMTSMKRAEVLHDARTVRAQAGMNWGEFDAATQAHGLAVTGGRVTTTGIAGLTLGSGSGWMERMYGSTCDNLTGVQLVAADGTLHKASSEENPELLWGLRGGGGNFGVATEFEYRLQPIGPIVLGGLLLHPRERAPEVLRFYRDFMQDAPRELGGAVSFITAPPAPFVPPEMQMKPALAVVVAWFGEIERGQQVIAELRRFADPPVDVVQPMPYVALQSLLDGGNPYGRRNYWRSENMQAMPDAAIDALIDCAARATSPFTQMIVVRLGGALRDLPEDAGALGGRSSEWQYHGYAVWEDQNDQTHIDWVRATERALNPYTMGRISINFVSEAGSDRVRAAFSGETYRRLVALKDRYDPSNVFKLNQNIQPSK